MIIFPYSLKEKTIALTVDTNAYASGDAVDVAHEVKDATATKGGQSRLVKVVVTDASEQMANLKIILFNKAIAAATDNAVFDPTDTELKTIIGVIPIKSTDYVDFNDNAVATIQMGDNSLYIKTVNSSSVWAQVVSADAPTYAAATDVQITYTFEQQ